MFARFSELNCVLVLTLVVELKCVIGLMLRGSKFKLWEVVVKAVRTLPGKAKNDQRLRDVTIWNKLFRYE